jgi:hypothetical protein
MSAPGASNPLDTVRVPRRPLHIRVRSLNLSFSADFSTDSNTTTTGLPGPGRVLGHLFSAGGRRLETIVNRTAAVAGLGYEDIARRLLVRLRGWHARYGRCVPSPGSSSLRRFHPDSQYSEFPSALEIVSSSSVLDVAVELGIGYCNVCKDKYSALLDNIHDADTESLLLRLVPALQLVFTSEMASHSCSIYPTVMSCLAIESWALRC